MLGTFITQGDEGSAVCDQLLSTKESAQLYAKLLAELAVNLGFDGWLVNNFSSLFGNVWVYINIGSFFFSKLIIFSSTQLQLNMEVSLKPEQIPTLKEFVSHLSLTTHSSVPGSLVIWWALEDKHTILVIFYYWNEWPHQFTFHSCIGHAGMTVSLLTVILVAKWTKWI